MLSSQVCCLCPVCLFFSLEGSRIICYNFLTIFCPCSTALLLFSPVIFGRLQDPLLWGSVLIFFSFVKRHFLVMNHTYIVTHFCLLHFLVQQVEEMRAAGLIKGGSLENAMVCR